MLEPLAHVELQRRSECGDAHVAKHIEHLASLNPLFQKGRFLLFVARLCVEGGFVRIYFSLALYERCRRFIVEPL